MTHYISRFVSLTVLVASNLLSIDAFARQKADPVAVHQESAPALYQKNCASCHGADRLGGMGPALLPSNLERLRKDNALQVIREGRVATQMPAYQNLLSENEIQTLRDYIYTALPMMPVWGEAEIRASRVIYHGELPAQPVFKADLLNLFVVVETGDHHANILDGDRFEVIQRFPTRYALHGGPKFSPDGRYVYFASRDGWIAKYDIWNLKLVAEVRAGINTRNMAVSSDGRYAMVANYFPATLVVLDTRDLTPVRVMDVKDSQGKASRVSAVYDAAPRQSFVAALKDVPEVWEMSYAEPAPKVYEGLVHDYQMGEAVAVPGPFAARRIRLDTVLDDFFFDAKYDHVIGASREGQAQVINLNIGRKVASLDLPGMPHLGSGISWSYQGSRVLATPNLKQGLVTVIDMKNWTTVAQISTRGPGFFMRSHENTHYAWVDVFNGSENKDVMQLIDKQTLKVAHELIPSPGKIAAHTEFTRDGRYALVSIWDKDGELVVYDTRSLQIVKRLPMNKPSGKYNVFNKITRSEGTSH